MRDLLYDMVSGKLTPKTRKTKTLLILVFTLNVRAVRVLVFRILGLEFSGKKTRKTKTLSISYLLYGQLRP